MRDFTLLVFKSLCLEFQKNGYGFLTFADYCLDRINAKFIIVRHDVDNNPGNALDMAILEHDLGIRASYYFRVMRASFNERIIGQIAEMGHEIGYHYEDLALAKGDVEQAIILFEKNLTKLRQLFPVKTICMHGSPLSKWDNRMLWEKYSYRNYGIIGEPYFDVDFNEVLYLTDTGRRWNGTDVSVRDKVNAERKCCFRSTYDIMRALENDSLPERVMMCIHPQRWTNRTLPWLQQLIWQNTKNHAKKYFFVNQ